MGNVPDRKRHMNASAMRDSASEREKYSSRAAMLLALEMSSKEHYDLQVI